MGGELSFKKSILSGTPLTSKNLNDLYAELAEENPGVTFQEMNEQKNVNGKTSYQILADHLALMKPVGKILDLGCGQGEMVGFLSRYGFGEYYGIDISRGEVERARQKNSAPNIHFKVDDAAALEQFEDGSFDFAISHMFLHICSEPLLTLKNVYRVLIPRGCFLAVVRDMDSPSPALYVLRQTTKEYFEANYPTFSESFYRRLSEKKDQIVENAYAAGFSYESFHFQLFPKTFSPDFMLSMYPACLLEVAEKHRLQKELNFVSDAIKEEEIFFPMKLLVLKKR